MRFSKKQLFEYVWRVVSSISALHHFSVKSLRARGLQAKWEMRSLRILGSRIADNRKLTHVADHSSRKQDGASMASGALASRGVFIFTSGRICVSDVSRKCLEVSGRVSEVSLKCLERS